MKNKFHKIISFVICTTIVLSALIIVPATHIVEAEAAYDPSLGMYSRLSNVFTGSELHSLVNASNQMSYSYDNTEKALKLTINNATSDPYVGFNLSGAKIDLSIYTRVVVIYKMPTSNKQEWQRIQMFWWNQNNDLKYSGDYDGNCAWYRSGSYYFDIRPNLLTTGTLTTFRLDPMTWAQFWNVGDTIYIDSIAFFKNDDEAQLYRREREAVRNKESDSFTIMPSAFTAQNAFSELHNINVTYNSSYNAFQLTTANNCASVKASSTGYVTEGKYSCWDYTRYNSSLPADYHTVFDPYVTLSCNVDLSKYKYVTISYCMPGRGDASTLGGAGFTAGMKGLYDARGEGVNHGTIKPIFASGKDGTSYSMRCQYDPDLRTYIYTQIFDFSSHAGDSLVGLRFDPFEYTFSKLNQYVYIKEITFSTNTTVATNAANTMLQQMTGYSSFNLGVNYNGNAISGTTVSNLPSEGTPLKYVSIPGAASYSYSVPSTVPSCSDSSIKFDGWATSPDGAVVVTPGNSLTVSGSGGVVTKPTLYAKWHYSWGYITLNVNNTNSGVDPNQTYLFRITGSGVDATVSITGNSSAKFYLQSGQYVIVCLNDWSWRYSSSGAQNPMVTDNGNTQVTFTFTDKNDKWLNGFGQYPN